MTAIIAANLLTFGYEASLDDGSREAFIGVFALVPFNLTHGVALAGGPLTVGTLVTSQFLHASVLHIAFNLMFLGAFGPAIEASFGSLRFALVYLVCGVLGGLAQVSVDPGSHVPQIGASGAIAGVLGAFIVRYPHAPSFLRVPAFAVIGLWAAVQLVHGFGTLSSTVLSERGGSTAYFAHIGGFLAGVFAAELLRPRSTSPLPDRRI